MEQHSNFELNLGMDFYEIECLTLSNKLKYWFLSIFNRVTFGKYFLRFNYAQSLFEGRNIAENSL